MLPTKFDQEVSEEKTFQKSTNQEQELPVAAMSVNESGEMGNIDREPSIDASYKASVHLAKRFQRKIFFYKSTNQKQELPEAAIFVNRSGQIEQSLQRTFHRCFLPSYGSFGQAISEEKLFRNRSIRNKNCLWRPCLLTDRIKTCNLYRGLSIDVSYQVSVPLARVFQRRRLKCEKLTDDRRRSPSNGKSSLCLW